ncbi:MAG TPA: glycosyltransferase family 4 protein [Solirubrobacteraceae bacterium]|nr:glycosyltransferase family 4 protein [Solirubrobacteraceae bacterium]
MRVLVLNQYYPPDAANTARLLADWLEEIARDHDVEIIAGRPSYNATGDVPRTQGSVKVTRVPSLGVGRGTLLARALTYLSYLVFAGVRSLFVRRPDIVVALTDPPVVGAIGAVAAARYRRPLVFVSHDVHPDIGLAMGVLHEGPLVRLWRLVNRFIRSRSQMIVVVGRDMARRLEEQGVPAEKLVYVPTWASGDTLGPEERERLRAEQGWSGRFVVMHAGNMGMAQNLTMIPDVAERLQDEPDIRLVFLGDGPARPALAAEVERRGLDNVEILPYRPRAEAQLLMAAADLHLVSLIPGLRGCAAPSKTYGVMAAGRPFVAAVDERSEPQLIAEEWDCGARVPAGDAAAVAEAIVAMRARPLAAMGARARAGYESRFTKDRCVGDLAAVLERTGR